MNILICAVQQPFVRGGAEILVEGLAGALRRRQHQVDVVAVPFVFEPKSQIMKNVATWRLLDVTESNGKPVDLVICTKFPSYVVNHPNKVTWLVHQFRQAYDWYGTPYSDFVNNQEDNALRKNISRVDAIGLRESQKLLTISKNVSERLATFNGVGSSVLYPPVADLAFHAGPFGDYVLFVGRLDPAKRVDLFLQGLARTESPVRAVIAGKGTEEQSLRKLARKLGVAERVEFAGYVDDARLVELYAGCFSVFYAPIDEDYGYTTIEAFKSEKPVVTSTDAGGVLEFVRDGETGSVAEPDPDALAGCIDDLYKDRGRCKCLGARGADSVRSITWDAVVEALVG